MPPEEATAVLLACCGSRAWAQTMTALRPLHDAASLYATADRVWSSLPVDAWDEAFRSHPRIGEPSAAGIGEHKAAAMVDAQFAAWSSQEQSRVAGSSTEVQERLREGNAAYEARFGRIYIVCATGKSAEEMLVILERRLAHDPATELREAAEQQRRITRLRLEKWLAAPVSLKP